MVKPVLTPNKGLYLNQTPLDIPRGALQDGYNFRVENGKINNLNLGWGPFDVPTLNGPVILIDNFFPRGNDEQLIFGTPTDLYRYVPGPSGSVEYITPQYDTGTASTAGTAVTGIGTDWDPNVKAGDQIHFGAANYTDPTGTWFTILSRNSDTSLTLTASAGVIGAGPYTVRRLFSGTVDDLWSYDTFVQDSVSGDDLWIATNGVDSVVSWNGNDPSVTLNPQLGFTCKVVTTFSNMMIYQNLVQTGVSLPTSIINSDIGSPLDVTTGLSEQFRIHDGTDEILNAIPLGDSLVFYSERHIVMAQFVGDPLVFLFRNAMSGIGTVAMNAIADFGDFHEFLAADAQYAFDGVSVREINPQVWREIIKTADPIRKRHIYAHFDEERGDLIWSVPATTDAGAGDFEAPPESAWPEHYLEDVGQDFDTPYSARAFPFTATGFYEQSVGLTWANAIGTWADFNFSWNDQFNALGFPINLAGNIDGNVFVLNKSQYADGVLLPSFVHFHREPTSDGIERNLIKRIYPYMEPLGGPLSVRLWITDHAAGQTIDAGTYTFDMDLLESVFFVSPYRRGRYFEVEFYTDGEGWQTWGYDTEIEKGGRR